MATTYTENGDPANSADPTSADDYEVMQLLAALNGQIARTQALIGRVASLVAEMDKHRKAGPKFRVPPR
jgi:hypothetical protein